MWRGDVVEPAAGREVALDVGEEAAEHVGAGRRRVGGAEEAAVDLGEQIGVLVGGAAEHDAVDVGEVRLGLVEARDAAVDDDGEVGARGLEAVHAA